MRPLDEVLLLRTALGIEHRRQSPGLVDVVQDVQQRDLLGLAPPRRAPGDRDEVARGGRGARAGQPRAEALGIQVGRVGSGGRITERNRPRQPVERQLDAADVEQPGPDRWNGAPVATVAPAPADDVLARGVGPVARHPHLVGEGEDAVLRGADERSAEIHVDPVDIGGCHATADAGGGLEHAHRQTELPETVGCRQPGQPGADDDDVDLGFGASHGCSHRLAPIRVRGRPGRSTRRTR